MKKVYEEARAALKKTQEEMKRYTIRRSSHLKMKVCGVGSDMHRV